MSYYIIQAWCPNAEDYEPYARVPKAGHYPDMWPEELHAEGALWEEHKAMIEQAAMLRRCKMAEPVSANRAVLIKALVSIARDNDWDVKNKYAVENYGCSPIYAIPPAPEEEAMPERWFDIVRWMDRQQSRAEKAMEVEEAKRVEREAKRRRDDRIVINYDELTAFMGELLPCNVEAKKKKKRAHFAGITDIQTYVCAVLADENGWKNITPDCDPYIYSNPPHEKFRIV